MPLETATYVNQLNASNPAHTDQLNLDDSHARLIKSTLLASFPNIGGAATISHTQLNTLATAVAAGLSLVPTGAMMPFAGVNADANWLRCNGATFVYETHPALGAFLGYTAGQTVTLPNLEDTGRFVRSVKADATITVRQTQANQNAAHTHTGSVTTTGTVAGSTGIESADHTHAGGGTTSGHSNDHTHGPGNGDAGFVFAQNAGGYQFGNGSGSHPVDNTFPAATGGVSADHTHSYNFTTAGVSANHTHSFSVGASLSGSFTTASSGGTEARPESYAAIWYIHL